MSTALSIFVLLAFLGVLHDVSSMLKLHLENCDRLARFRYEMSGATGGAPLFRVPREEGGSLALEDEPGGSSSFRSGKRASGQLVPAGGGLRGRELFNVGTRRPCASLSASTCSVSRPLTAAVHDLGR